MTASETGHLSLLRFSGKDAADFLHRQVSADINQLDQGASTFACLCQPKGRVIALLLVRRAGDHIDVVLSSELADTVCTGLKRFVFRDDVQIQPMTEAFIRPVTTPSEDPVIKPPLGPAYRIADEPGTPAEPFESLRAQELATGICWLNATTTERFLPQWIGAEHIGALNFRKGCYPGQEIVARTHYLGKLKQRPLLLIDESSKLHLAPLQKVQLRQQQYADAEDPDQIPIEATVVDQAIAASGARYLLVVARSMDETPVDLLHDGEQNHPVRSQWFPVPKREAKS